MASLFESYFPEPLGKGERAKAAILQAAAAEFGERGLEAARTRQIAKASGQNLGAIHYYFGSKEQLYLALVELTVGFAGRRIEPLIASAERALADPAAGPSALGDAAWNLLNALIDTIVAREETLPISLIMVREQMCPTSAYEIFYDKFLRPLHETLTALVARILAIDPEAPLAICRAHALLGQVLVFRAGRATICSRVGWTRFAEAESRTVRAAIQANLQAILSNASRAANPSRNLES